MRGPRDVEANLWGSALVFSCLCLLSRVGRTAKLVDHIDGITVILYVLGWVGPALALALCAARKRRPWNGAVVPVTVHAASGLLYGAGIGWE
ncbi:hypothetical protein AC230_14110 [Streptomyces caatingaensis]|uniref:Uncharacterized protein n=1 Tax=Streptomyces caatingaensis TaxID=1678637 RepID=A0A0K9XEI7_9ACTN|nr:hypothetical protein AC230_14110 [Streptomyces caatingaensis]